MRFKPLKSFTCISFTFSSLFYLPCRETVTFFLQKNSSCFVHKTTYKFDEHLLTFLKTIFTTCPRISGLILLVITKISPSCSPKTLMNTLLLRFRLLFEVLIQFCYVWIKLQNTCFGITHKTNYTKFLVEQSQLE